MTKSYQAIDFADKLLRFSDQWTPHTVAALNDYHFKVAKIEGEFVWHSHPETDEAFIVLKGSMRIELRDGAVDLEEGQMYVVPKGVEHKPVAEKECSILLIEPSGTVNTGDAGGDRTSHEVWI
ncbi:MAG TPA: cupin domain-containing protein [Acidobacteriota bacterium]|nr:cupin domain-containing protein [Acidobacteriota bacterium]